MPQFIKIRLVVNFFNQTNALLPARETPKHEIIAWYAPFRVTSRAVTLTNSCKSCQLDLEKTKDFRYCRI
jgi:hypothetical protein